MQMCSARNEELGKAAVSELEKEGLHPKFHQLDIEDAKSIERLAQYLKQTYGGIDILINNAGFSFKVLPSNSFVIKYQILLCDMNNIFLYRSR